MKKVLLTGHSKGLGKAIHNELREDYLMLGVSRSNGKNIRDIVCEEYDDCDILINNAYHSTGQLGLLKSFYEMWRGKSKTIINVGTAGLDAAGRPYETLNYNAAKKQLETYSRWISDNDSICRCMLFSPGFMKTELVQSKMDHWPEDKKAKFENCELDVKYAAKTVRMMIESPFVIRDLQLLPKECTPEIPILL